MQEFDETEREANAEMTVDTIEIGSKYIQIFARARAWSTNEQLL